MVLSLLAALEPLSIDIYLPAFTDIAQSLSINIAEVQISLSTFLAGFAFGQLLWGPISDYYGRKSPLIIAMLIFIVCSFVASHAMSIEQLWIIRFFQAFSGCAGVVIGRAIVNDIFEGDIRTKVFSLLVIISGVSPIIAPSIGNEILKIWHWQGIFHTMAIIGIITTILVIFFLPRSKSVIEFNLPNMPKPNFKNMVIGYVRVMGNWQFIIYTLIGAMLYAFLMTYVSNAPFIIITTGGLSSDVFSAIFAVNAIGLILGTLLINPLSKRIELRKLVKSIIIFQLPTALLLILLAIFANTIIPLLVMLFINLILLGILMPTTTALALEPFTKKSGTASALLGFIQLFFTFVFSTAVSYLQNNSIIPVMSALTLCAILSVIILMLGNSKKIQTSHRKIRCNMKSASKNVKC